MENTFFDKVKKYVKENSLIAKGDSIVIGVSGGADSLALFYFLLSLKSEYGLKLFVVHVNHGLREEAKEEAEYVEKICRDNSVGFFLKNADIKKLSEELGMGTEETGRKVRYEFFEEILQKEHADSIAIAHNMNDLSETMLFNLSRGTGIRGLASIPPKRGNIIRPLLCLKRSEIEKYLNEQGIKYCTDASNFSDEYTRNRIRNKVLPLISEEVSKRAVEHMAETAAQLRELTCFFDSVIDSAFSKCLQRRNPGKVVYDKEQFLLCDVVIQKGLVKRAIDELVPKNRDITHLHLEAVCDIADCNGTKTVNLPYKIKASVSYNNIEFEIGTQKRTEIEETELLENDTVYLPGNISVQCELLKNEEGFDYGQKQYTKCFDYDKIDESLVIRTRQKGDEITVTSKGGKKKLKDFMIDEKIPAAIRDEVLLVASGKNILWVVGYRMSEAAKITENTKQIVKITVFKEE